MSKSAIYTVNQTPQSVDLGGTINPGTVIRRYGCNMNLSGNAIRVDGTGYYDCEANVTATPAEAGTLTVTMMKDGVAVPGATASTTAAGTDPVSLSLGAVIRESCCCDSASNITFELSGTAATVNNIAVKCVKL